MDEEIQSLHKNETWELCKLPKRKKQIVCKLVFMKKKVSLGSRIRYKANLVAKAYA